MSVCFHFEFSSCCFRCFSFFLNRILFPSVCSVDFPFFLYYPYFLYFPFLLFFFVSPLKIWGSLSLSVVSTTILSFSSMQERAQMIEYWLAVCEHCKFLKNYQVFFFLFFRCFCSHCKFLKKKLRRRLNFLFAELRGRGRIFLHLLEDSLFDVIFGVWSSFWQSFFVMF